MITKTLTSCTLKRSGVGEKSGKAYTIYTYQFSDGTTAEGFTELQEGEHTGEWKENGQYAPNFLVQKAAPKFSKKAKAMELAVNLVKSGIHSSDTEIERELVKWQQFFESRI